MFVDPLEQPVSVSENGQCATLRGRTLAFPVKMILRGFESDHEPSRSKRTSPRMKCTPNEELSEVQDEQSGLQTKADTM